ncbi:hypothetical protein JY651_36625 [Pyxidicoccus parkwayensis]|uniref:Uncharacterized protein n=1 Tax=Pyxidicoccus parkwayensis TaxID=2813578 RepID=A0ABX7PDH4_9BACT|nr:hypothetical protein JY651_36625 [Pyxidicoccus parkwaysis]
MEDALAEGRAREDAWVEEWVRRTGQMPSRKVRRRWEKKWRREAKRATRRAELEQERDPLRGGIYAAVAVAAVLIALSRPAQLWWLIFIALSFFMTAAKHLGRPRKDALRDAVEGRDALGEGAERSGQQLPGGGAVEAPAADRASAREARPSGNALADPRVAKVDALCSKLLEELRGGPAVLREVVHAPERTVEALQKGCHELVRRERELRALSTPEESKRLEAERESLAARVSAEQDAVVRERLSGALAALDEQRRQRAELTTAANRLEAEHTRLYYTLEGLYAQVLRVRSADAAGEDVGGAGLRQSVEQLGSEVEAVTEALEEVHRPHDGRVRTR